MAINKTKFLRRMISSKEYFSNRMSKMDSECSFYLDQSAHASNKKLRRAFLQTAAMYFKRYNYYLNKISNNELRESIPN